MSLSPIGSAVFELLSRKHTYIQTDIHHITLEYRYFEYYYPSLCNYPFYVYNYPCLLNYCI